MKFLITGIAGFLGTALAWRLLEDGHEVRGIDDLSAGREDRLPPGASLERGDVNDVPKLWTMMQGVDAVIHLAARVSVSESMRYPRDYNAVNLGGTVSVLEAMRDTGTRRIVFSSSGAIYGAQETQPLHEDMHPQPGSPYAVSKLASEYYIRTLGALWNLEAICLRIFNVFGPGQPLPPSHPPVIPQTIRQILGEGSIIVSGDGTQTRDFIYIDDVTAALARAATLEDYAGQFVVNVGSGVETTLNDLVDLIATKAHKSADILYNMDMPAGVKRMQADLEALKTHLGIAPQTSLAMGIERILNEDERFSS